MVWQKWNVIAVLILANYLVFATLGTLVFTDANSATPTRGAEATFTPRPTELKRVTPIQSDLISPAPSRGTATRTATPAATASLSPVASTATPAGPTATLIRPTPTETAFFATPAPAFISVSPTP